jgi:hypothetical protein
LNQKTDDKGITSASDVSIIQLALLEHHILERSEEAEISLIESASNKQKSIPNTSDLMPLLIEFHRYLISEKIEADRLKELANRKNAIRLQATSKSPKFNNDKAMSSINWIENILQKGIDDYRKNHVPVLILAPYLINIKHMKYADAFKVMSDWYYNKCKPLRSINAIKIDSVIANALNNAIETRIKPMSTYTLKKFNPKLYDKVVIG